MNKTTKLVFFVVLIVVGLVAFKFLAGMLRNILFIAVAAVLAIGAYRFVFGSKAGKK
ncbi:hypothetical protein [Microscilla marina]|uniref:Uncharacterized protein n=1 Tax=Microscilla marina ATCC 23134 TaxID=313606 RepID=A1ZTG2_MICM2|nr:hypothetical protein [Microscilla marina]EAY26384.1 hypothetical protein M23134_04662 [Microscilla marina ATCC 23134]